MEVAITPTFSSLMNTTLKLLHFWKFSRGFTLYLSNIAIDKATLVALSVTAIG
jgi:hypothetical protein